MKSFITCLVLIMGISAFGQYEPEELEMPDTRNTIGVNITPAALVVMNSIPVSPRFSLVYKRQVALNKKLRAMVNYQIEERFFDVRDDVPYSFSDTTITYLLETRDAYYYDFRVGMEFFKPNRTTTMVYGFDAVIGWSRDYESDQTQPFYIDPICDCTVPSPFVASQTSSSELQHFIVGADFSIGQKLNVGENFNFTLQWMPTLAMKIPISETYSDPEVRSEAPSNELFFNMKGIEILLHYIF